MSDVRIAPFHPAHLDLMEVRDYELELFGPEALGQLANTGQCITMAISGVLTAVLGYFILRPGVLEVFVIPSKHLKACSFVYLRWVRRYMESTAKHLGVHRMQTFSRADAETDRWMKHLGFTLEGTLQQYTADRQNYRLWARIW
jgi:hypothetical protein